MDFQKLAETQSHFLEAATGYFHFIQAQHPMSLRWRNTARAVAVTGGIPRYSTLLNSRSIVTSAACRAKRPQSLAEADSRPVKAVRQMEFQSYNLNPYPRVTTPPSNAPSMSIPLIKKKWDATLEKAQKADQLVTLTGMWTTASTNGNQLLKYLWYFRTYYVKERI